MGKYKQRVNQRLRNDESVRTLTNEELSSVHLIYLRMAKDVIDICTNNGIYLTLSGGSVLGAVRHQGFIPWDDDMDFNISREGMEMLKLHFSEWFQGKYILHAPNYDSENETRMGKIQTEAVQIIDYNGKQHGLEIDLFVLENMPDQSLLYRLHGLRSLLYTAISGLVLDYEYARDDPDGIKKVTAEQKLRRVLGKMLSVRSARKWLNKLDQVNQYRRADTARVGIPTGRNHYFGETYARQDMMESILLPFEGELFPVPKGYDTYLKQLYHADDYMTVPKEEKREYHYIRSIRFMEDQYCVHMPRKEEQE